ncbi:hypothetical protein VTK56DRAFT_9860 [Thermocarpiscus australiensis]
MCIMSQTFCSCGLQEKTTYELQDLRSRTKNTNGACHATPDPDTHLDYPCDRRGASRAPRRTAMAAAATIGMRTRADGAAVVSNLRLGAAVGKIFGSAEPCSVFRPFEILSRLVVTLHTPRCQTKRAALGHAAQVPIENGIMFEPLPGMGDRRFGNISLDVTCQLSTPSVYSGRDTVGYL